MRQRLSLGLCLTFAVGCGGSSPPPQPVQEAPSPNAVVPKSQVPSEPLVKTDEEFDSEVNKLSTDGFLAKYKGATFDISGKVRYSTENTASGNPTVILSDSRQIVTLELDSSEQKKSQPLARGQIVSIRAKCADSPRWLKEGTILKVDKSTATEFAAKDLIQQFTDNRQKLRESVNDKSLLVSGKVIATKNDEANSNFDITLGCGEPALDDKCKITVSCKYSENPALRKKLESIKVGQSVSVMGEAGVSIDEIHLLQGKILDQE